MGPGLCSCPPPRCRARIGSTSDQWQIPRGAQTLWLCDCFTTYYNTIAVEQGAQWMWCIVPSQDQPSYSICGKTVFHRASPYWNTSARNIGDCQLMVIHIYVDFLRKILNRFLILTLHIRALFIIPSDIRQGVSRWDDEQNDNRSPFFQVRESQWDRESIITTLIMIINAILNRWSFLRLLEHINILHMNIILIMFRWNVSQSESADSPKISF